MSVSSQAKSQMTPSSRGWHTNNCAISSLPQRWSKVAQRLGNQRILNHGRGFPLPAHKLAARRKLNYIQTRVAKLRCQFLRSLFQKVRRACAKPPGLVLASVCWPIFWCARTSCQGSSSAFCLDGRPARFPFTSFITRIECCLQGCEHSLTLLFLTLSAHSVRPN